MKAYSIGLESHYFISEIYHFFCTSSIGKQLHNSALGIINNLHSNIKIWHLPTCFLVLKKGIMKYLYKKKFNDQCSSWPGLLLYHFAYKKFFFRVHLSNYTEDPVHDYMYIIAGLLSADFLQYYTSINMIFQKMKFPNSLIGVFRFR